MTDTTQLIALRKEAVHPSVTVQMRLAAMTAADTLEAQALQIKELSAYVRQLEDAITPELVSLRAENESLWRLTKHADKEIEELRAGGQEPVAWSVTVGTDYKNCVEITHCESDAIAQYEASIEGGFESIYTLHKLYAAPVSNPKERQHECMDTGKRHGDGTMTPAVSRVAKRSRIDQPVR